MTTFNIDTFINSLNKQGTVQTNKYEVKIARPRIFVGNEAIFEQLKYRAESVRVPGITLETTDVRRYGHDIRQKTPTNASYNDIGITFIEQDMNRISKFFYYWLDSIYGFRSIDSGDTTVTVSNAGGSPNTNLPGILTEYKDYYSTRIEIDVYNNSGDLSMSVILEDAFPISMGDVSLGWSDRNSLYKLNVSFSYSFITIRGQSNLGFARNRSIPIAEIEPLPLLPSLPPI
jgi:hypothetical protein